MTLDVFTFGEAMLRLSVRTGQRLESAPSFDVHVAGSEANVAANLARLERRVAWASRLPEGPLGRRVIADLTGAGVDCSGVVVEQEGRMGIFFVELHAPPRSPSVLYDRAGPCFASMSPEDIPWKLVDAARVVHLSGITAALSKGCLEAMHAIADRAHSGGALLSIDINYRSKLWNPLEAASVLSGLAEGADLLVCTSEDARELFGLDSRPKTAAKQLAQRFAVDRVVVTDRENGASWSQGGSSGHSAALPVSIVDPIGAGDAFTAGVLDGLLDGDFEAGVHRGTTLAAIALTTRGDHAVTSRGEMESLLDGERRKVDR